nr:TRAP transporter substrate-binding protein [Mesorhizobium sp.]
MSIRSSIFAAATAMVASVAIFSSTAIAETLRLAHHHAVGGQVDTAANKFAELVKEYSNGDITIQVFPAAQLGQEREALDLVNQGAIDISITSTPILDKLFPPMASTSAPLIFKGWEHARKVYKGEYGQALVAGVRDNSDVEILTFIHLGFRDLMFKGDAPLTLAGIAGKRMRSPENFVWIRMFELMGAKPTPVTWGEVYTAMQTGVAEGFDTSAQAALDMKFNEVSNSLLKTQHMFGSMLFAMNENKFAALSPDKQELLKKAAADTGDYADAENQKLEAEAYSRLEAAGIKILEPTNPQEWRDAMGPLQAEIAEKNPGADKFIEMVTSVE